MIIIFINGVLNLLLLTNLSLIKKKINFSLRLLLLWIILCAESLECISRRYLVIGEVLDDACLCILFLVPTFYNSFASLSLLWCLLVWVRGLSLLLTSFLFLLFTYLSWRSLLRSRKVLFSFKDTSCGKGR